MLLGSMLLHQICLQPKHFMSIWTASLPNKQKNKKAQTILLAVTAVYQEVNDGCKHRESMHWQQRNQA